MSDVARWQQGNDAYLAAALHWLRLRLVRLAQEEAAPEKPAPGAKIDLFGLFRQPAHPNAASAPQKRVSEADVRTAAAQMEAAAATEPPALFVLSQHFGLSRFEQAALLLCAAMELDTRVPALCARAQGDPGRPYATFALALALFDDPAWDVLSPDRPLRFWRLIEINQPGGQPLTSSPLRADERIVNYIKGLNYLDDRLAPLLAPLASEAEGAQLPPSQNDYVERVLQHVQQAAPVIQLVGSDSQSKQLVAWHATARLGISALRLPAVLLPTQAGELETLVRLWQRENRLLPVALYLDAGAELSADQAAALQRFLARSDGLLFLDTREVRPDLSQSGAVVDVAKPAPVEQRAAWAELLPQMTADTPALLAGQFNLNLPAIRQIAQTTLARAADTGRQVHDQLWAACLVRTRPQLGTLAQRLQPKATWGDIVLPAEQERLLRQIAAQVGQRSQVYDEWGFRHKMNRGLGISALFAGPSGTGKTMAAEVIANELRLDLYRIDLSSVVSKYIGETEKNLRRLFDAAEDGGAILFFDEADALFGKRSEVKDSHDRYANIEINYLLQRMEAYRGLAILATNMKSALDEAFMRRLRFIVNFPFPGQPERQAIWQRVFPSQTPTVGLDHGWLARLSLAGGSIHNVALNAAFLAARTGQPVTMPVVLDAARAEFRKLERPVREADFRWIAPNGSGAS